MEGFAGSQDPSESSPDLTAQKDNINTNPINSNANVQNDDAICTGTHEGPLSREKLQSVVHKLSLFVHHPPLIQYLDKR